MGVFNTPTGVNLTDNDLINKSPFVASFAIGAGNVPPPPGSLMITEDGNYMITESGDYMEVE